MVHISSTLRLVYHIEQCRTCSVCAATKTYNLKWYRDGNSGYYHCSHCHQNLVYRPKWNPLTNPRRINFKGKRIYLAKPPRKGVCSICKTKVGQFHPRSGNYVRATHMHHIEYDSNNPSANTIEVCPSCHRQEHQKKKKLKRRESLRGPKK
jgi:hypothetical protein